MISSPTYVSTAQQIDAHGPRYQVATTGPERLPNDGGPSMNNHGRRLTVRELLDDTPDHDHRDHHHHLHRHHHHHHHQFAATHPAHPQHPQRPHALPVAPPHPSLPPTPALGGVGSPYLQHLSIAEGTPNFTQPLTPATTAASSPNPNSVPSPSVQHVQPAFSPIVPPSPAGAIPTDELNLSAPLSLHERRERNKLASAKYRRKKQQQSQEMSCRIEDLNSRINTLTAETTMLVRQLDELKRENTDLRDTIDKLKSKLVEDKILKRLGRGGVRTKITTTSAASAVRRRATAIAAASVPAPAPTVNSSPSSSSPSSPSPPPSSLAM